MQKTQTSTHYQEKLKLLDKYLDVLLVLSNGGEGTAFEPFSAAALNTYLLNGNQMGGLATYDFYAQYVELTAKMFGGFLNYNYNSATKQLTLMRDIKGSGEAVLLWCYNSASRSTTAQRFLYTTVDERLYGW